MASSSEIIDKIERFFNKVEDIMVSHGFTYIGNEDYKYCNDRIEYAEYSFEKDGENGKYVDIALKILLDENCNPIKVKDIDIDDDNLIDDELYEKIMELYKSIFS